MSVNTGRYRPDRGDSWKKKFGPGENVPRLALFFLTIFVDFVNLS